MHAWRSLSHIPQCLLLVLASSLSVSALWPFPPKRFTGNSFLEAGSLGLGDGRVVAFGDFDGDQFLDVVMLGGDDRSVTVYLWDHKQFMFHSSASFVAPERVYNVVPGDFTHDGTLDLLVMLRSSQTSAQDMLLYVGGREGFFIVSGLNTLAPAPSPITVPSSTLAQPIPIDANGDLKMDLLGSTPGSSSGTLRLWKNVYNESSGGKGSAFELTDALFPGQHCTLANPHSNALVDFDGDCLADVFLTCEDPSTGALNYQIWLNKKAAGFTLARTGKLPSGTQSIAFADMDRDGAIDLVILACAGVDTRTGAGNDCHIDIVYNQQLPLCTRSSTPIFSAPPADGGKTKRRCRPLEDLCTTDPDFHFDVDAGNPSTYQRILISALFPRTPQTRILVRDTSASPALPLAPHLGDANLDGFPDLLFVAVSPDGARSPRLALSVPCAPGVAGCGEHGEGRRGWRVMGKGAEVFNGIVDARGAAFIDVDEDGTLDVMVQRTGSQGQGTILFVQNNFFYDAFFLKTIVLNGACDNGWCTRPNSSEKYHPFGVSYSGASYKYTVLDTSGRRSAAEVGQLPQTSYHALLTPYAFFGLGRTNNYIENLFVGATHFSNSTSSTRWDSAQHFINMEGVIPNSKVVIYPPAVGDSGAGWRRELYLRPGAWIPLVTLTIIVLASVLAVVVGVLHWNEKREDELERRRASHMINFDAL